MATAAPPPMAPIGEPPPPDASAGAVSVSVLPSPPGVASSSPPAGEACIGLGCGGEGDGGGGDGCGGGESSGGPSNSLMMGSDSTVMPSAAEAEAAVPRVEESEVCTAAGVVEAGTVIVAVMITLAAVTSMDTEAAATLAASAIELWRAEVLE